MKFYILLIIPLIESFKLFNKNNLNKNFNKKIKNLNNYIDNNLKSSISYNNIIDHNLLLSINNIIDNDLFLLKTIVSISAIECLCFNHFMKTIYPEFMEF